MAKKVQTITTFVDDLDGTELEESQGETVLFSLDGVAYEIDLSSKNAKKLRNALEPFIGSGRRVSRFSAGRASGASKGANKEELAAARAWLRENGHEVSDRGRIAAPLMELYRSSK